MSVTNSNCPNCRISVGDRVSTNHEYPAGFGEQHEVMGRCVVCGNVKMISNTTHRRFTQLGGVCRWEKCPRRAEEIARKAAG